MERWSYMRKIAVCLLIASVAMGSVSARGVQETESPAAVGTPVEVVFWHSSSGLAGEAMTDLITGFNATSGTQKGIVVKEVFQGKPSDVSTKLRASLQAGRSQDLPDLAQLDATGVVDVRESTATVPMATLVGADPTFDITRLEPGALLSVTYRNVLIGMPFNCSTIVLYYNKDVFREVGLDPGIPPQTLADLAAYAGKLVTYGPDGETVTRYGFAGVPTTYELVSWIGQQRGYSYLTDMANGHDGNPTRVVFDEEGTLAVFLAEWKKVWESGGLGNLTSNVSQEFAAGKVAMYAASTSGLSTLLASVGGRFEVGVGYLPRVNAASDGGVNVGGGAIFAFENGNDSQKKASWEFLKFLMEAQSQFEWHRKTGYFPVNLDTYGLPGFIAHLETNPLFKVAINQLHDSDPHIQSVWWPNSYQAYYEIQNGIREMLEKGKSIDETVASLASVLNKNIADFNRMNP
ncbi:MAG: ABC transporter substrate-binding protein [Sphaerochaetaceae bacterium]